MYNADNVPAYVPHSRAAQWASAWNTAYDHAMSDGDKATGLCEDRAYRTANSILSTRSNQIKDADFVSWADEDRVARRGIVRRFVASEAEDKGDEPGALQIEVERYAPKRDGWEPSGEVVKLSYDAVNKIDALAPPSRVSRKDVELNEEIKAYIEALIAENAASTKAGQVITAPHAVKSLGGDLIGGYGVVWGNEEEKDIESDWFTKATDLWLDTYKNQPLMFDHASGIKIPDDPGVPEEDQDMPRRYKIGHVIKATPDEIGLWVEGVIDAHNDWVDGVHKLIDKGVLYFSSGSAPHLIKRAENGEIKSWPMIELSLTPTPAEPRRTNVTALGGNVRTAEGEPNSAARGTNGKSAQGDQTSNPIRRTLKMKSTELKRLRAFLVANADDELEKAVFAYKKARANFAKASPEEVPAAADEAAGAVSELEKMVGPIADQAKSVLGLDGDMVKTALFKMALENYSKQLETPEEEAIEPAPEEIPAEEMPMAEMPMSEPAAVVEDDGSGDMVPGDDYLEAGEPEDLLPEEEDQATMSFRPNKSTDLFSDDDELTYIDYLIEKEVNKTMKRLAPAQGGFATKSVNVNTGKGRPETPLRDLIRAVVKRSPDLERMNANAIRGIKALGINPSTAGGYLVPIEQSNQVIELLRSKSLFLKSPGSEAPLESLVTTMPLNSDSLTIPTMTGGSTAYWVPENGTITASQPTFGQKLLTAKKLATLVPISNELLEDSDPDVEGVVRDDIAQTMAREVDRVVLYGAGANGEPLGVYNNPSIVFKTALNAAPSYDNLNNLVMQVRLNDVAEDDSWGWVLNPRDIDAFRSLQDGQGAYIFAGAGLDAAAVGTPARLLNYPYFYSSTVALSGDGTQATDETDLFFGHWKDVVVAYRKTLEIKASDVAGTAFQSDQLWIRAILRMDVAIRHDAAISVYTDARKVVTV